MIIHRYYIGLAWSKQPSYTLKTVISIHTQTRMHACIQAGICHDCQAIKTHDSIAKHNLIFVLCPLNEDQTIF